MPPLHVDIPSAGVPIKAWTRGVPLADNAVEQLRNTAQSPVVHGHVAVMPDCHWGLGATIGSVIPTRHAVIPAAVGVDIGCGMAAVRTTLSASDLPDDLRGLRDAIERAVPHGRTAGGRRRGDRGAWRDEVPAAVGETWERELADDFDAICARTDGVRASNHLHHLGTLGSGNHFIEVCLDEAQRVWFMLHSGSRGVGNRIAQIFIAQAKDDMQHHLGALPDADLAYLSEGSPHFDAYLEAVLWAQRFARLNRELMMARVLDAARGLRDLPPFAADALVVNCHHNYVALETHFGDELLITRKGAVSARRDELGIIPGSMGAKSFIVRGKGNAQSYQSCSHGAGRVMSRNAAKKRFSVDDHARATAGVECRKDAGVLDETPAAYKDIDAVMAAQADLVDVVHTLKQVVCVKG